MIPQHFKEHELWQLLEEINETVNNLPSISYQDDEDRHSVRERLPLYLSAVEQHKNNAAGYYSAQLLDDMYDLWKNIKTRVNQLEYSPSQAHSIATDLDTITGSLATWPAVFALKGFAAKNAIEAFEQAQVKWAERIEKLEQQLEAKEQELTDKEAQHQQQRQEIDIEIEGLYSRLEKNEELINTQNEKIADQATRHSELFEASQEERRQSYKKWLETQNSEIDEEAGAILTELGEKLSEGNEQLNEIKNLHESVEKAAHGATAVILARDYNTASKRDYWAGMFFMALGIALLVIAGIVLYSSFSRITPDTNITWQWTALKVSATLLITAGATFAFKFSQSFLTSSSRFKRSDLELRAINPFLANIGQKELADRTKIDFINRSFGQPDITTTDSKGKTTDTSSEATKPYKEIIDTLVSILKQNNS